MNFLKKYLFIIISQFFLFNLSIINAQTTICRSNSTNFLTDYTGGLNVAEVPPGLLPPPATPVAHWKFKEDATDEFETSNGILNNGDCSSYVNGFIGQTLDLSQGTADAPAYIEVSGDNTNRALAVNIMDNFTIV